MVSEDAVSPVIGTILLVALTLILVSIVAVVVMGFNAGESAPILGVSIGQEGNIITVTHLNGAELPAGSYKILVDGVDKTAEFGGTVNLSPGMTLQWDSGTEAVGTVSVVYTGTNGGDTILAQKKIDKAGSGKVVDHQILEIDGVKYSLLDSVWDGGGEWNELLDEANESITGSITLAENKVYYDGTYWWARESSSNYSLTTVQSQNDLNISEYMVSVGRGTLGWVKFNTTRVLGPEDGHRGGYDEQLVFNDNVKPIYTGSLFCNNTKLYVWASNSPANTFDASAINSWGWNEIGVPLSS